MPVLIPLSTEASVDKYTPEAGYVVLFATEVDGEIIIKCKKSDGSIVSISGVTSEEPSVEIDEVAEAVVVTEEMIEQATETLVVSEESVEDEVLTLG